MSPKSNRLRRALVTSGLVVGASLGAAGIAAAATTSTTPSTGSSSTSAPPSGSQDMPRDGTKGMPPDGAKGMPPDGAKGMPPDGAKHMPPDGMKGMPPDGAAPDPATMTHGPGETLLTGAQLQQATTAATGAVPGATVIRAETNSSGASPYEVHLKKADGTEVTVELNASFGVVTTVPGFGGGPAGGHAPRGAAAPSGSSTPTA